MDFDQALGIAGELGIYQIVLYCLLGLIGIPAAWHNLSIVFVGAHMEFVCRNEALSSFNEELTNWNRSLELETNNFTAIECPADNYVFSREVFKSTIRSEWNLECNKEFYVALSTTIYYAGFMTGCLIYGSISDTFGRRITLALSLVLEFAFGLGTALVNDFIWFCVLRFGLGANVAGSFTTFFVITMEIVGPRYRTPLGIFVQGWFSIGFMLLPAIAYFLRDHQHLQFALISPPIVLALCCVIIPESPRWLLTKKRYAEARRVIRKIARVNGKTANLEAIDMWFEELESSKGSIALEGSASKEKRSAVKRSLDDEIDDLTEDNDVDLSSPRLQQRRETIVDLFRTPNMRKKSLNICFNWFTNSVVYYGLSLGVSSLGGDLFFNTFLSGLVELPAIILAMFILDRCGRRILLAVLLAIGGLACIGTIPVLNYEHLNWLRTTLSMTGKFCVSATFAIIYVFTAELYPTVVRQVGVGVGSFSARVGGLVAPQVARLDVTWKPLPPLVFGALAIVAGGLTLLLPETNKQQLPETLEEGEQFGKK